MEGHVPFELLSLLGLTMMILARLVWTGFAKRRKLTISLELEGGQAISA
jgi:hypothetical protein